MPTQLFMKSVEADLTYICIILMFSFFRHFNELLSPVLSRRRLSSKVAGECGSDMASDTRSNYQLFVLEYKYISSSTLTHITVCPLSVSWNRLNDSEILADTIIA
jgi:hypothetical protein